MERKSWADANCPMARSVDLIGEWGSLLILREAFGGVRRFDDFQKQIGISRNLLTTRGWVWYHGQRKSEVPRVTFNSVAQGLCRLRGEPNRDFVDVDIRGLLDGRLRRIEALFGPGLMVSASSVFTAPGQIVVMRI